MQLKITDFTNKKEQLPADLAAEQRSNGEFVLRGVANATKRKRSK